MAGFSIFTREDQNQGCDKDNPVGMPDPQQSPGIQKHKPVKDQVPSTENQNGGLRGRKPSLLEKLMTKKRQTGQGEKKEWSKHKTGFFSDLVLRK